MTNTQLFKLVVSFINVSFSTIKKFRSGKE
jgi:hypothetical protein